MNQSFFLQGYSFWQASNDMLCPDMSFIPVLQRRRLTEVEKIGLFLANELKPLTQNHKTVFASEFGEWQQTFDLMKEFHSEKQMSPAGFSHSVHNAMPGIASVLSRDTNNYTTVAANEQTIDAGLLETFISDMPVLFIYAEEKAPDFYGTSQKQNCGIAFVVSNEPTTLSKKINVQSVNLNKNTSFKDLLSVIQSGGTLNTAFLRISVDAPV